ncbi:MAG: Rrf2 family transcriptional regulator [Sulfurospirillum sp.]|nr:Rrf2 family transcriptional regulator [Sulfurospirillum sp.]
MLLTKASEYALLSLIVIAKKDSPQDVETLSTQLGISKSFLAKILQSLAKEGIVQSFKGAHGGFILSKPPQELSIKAIIECAEKKPASVFECSQDSSSCPGNKSDLCRVWPFLKKLQSKIDEFLDNMSLQDIISD